MKKRLYLIGGPMGVGKTAVCRALEQKLDRCVFLDGDWCWDMHPFQVTEETKAMVLDNICYLLNRFIGCSAYETVLFCWVMHTQEIIDGILARLDTADCAVCTVLLVCDEETLRGRLQKDVAAGKRQPDVIERSLARLPLYAALCTARLDVSRLTAEQAAERILALGMRVPGEERR